MKNGIDGIVCMLLILSNERLPTVQYSNERLPTVQYSADVKYI